MSEGQGAKGAEEGKKDWGIQLPATDFPMRAQLPQREPQRLEFWDSPAFRDAMEQALQGREPFVLHDGPPYANGDIHIGHALNKTVKDLINKTRLFEGRAVRFRPGWDCHGLPIEIAAERKHGPASKLGRKQFRQACRELAAHFIERQKKDFRRLGVMGDWEGAYLTMDPAFEAGILRCLAEIYALGYIRPARKPVHWCTKCASALAEAEAEYKNITSTAVDVLYRVDPQLLPRPWREALGAESDCGLVAWTTTPWTLPASRALAVHPRLQYVLVQPPQGPALVLAQGLAQAWGQRTGLGEMLPLAEPLAGQELQGLQARHPYLTERQVPVLCADFVTEESGTGVVHSAPAHGLDDWRMGVENGLEVDDLLDDRGKFREGVPQVAGLTTSQATEPLLQELRGQGNLLAAAPYEHSYPHCWRHRIPVLFRATPQWFLSLQHATEPCPQGLLARAQQVAEDLGQDPPGGRERLAAMLQGRPDWCLSRQRTWGVPIPLLAHRESGQPHPECARLIHAVADAVERDGIDAWDDFDAAGLLGADPAQWRKLDDVLDVWFDSGSTWFSALPPAPNGQPPADLYVEGVDQHRGWFQSSLLVSTAVRGVPPYRGLLTHGFLIDEGGDKMSKSRGNVTAPSKVFDSQGADVLRLWVASSDFRNEPVISEGILRQNAETYRRFRNCLRYILGNLDGYTPDDAVAAEQLPDLDLWILRRLREVGADVQAAYAANRFHLVVYRLQNFVHAELSQFYFDVLKDRLYTMGRDSPGRRAAQTVLHQLGESLVRWLAPVLSFTAEEVWEHLRAIAPGPLSVFCATWHSSPLVQGAQPQNDWEPLLRLRREVHQALERARDQKLVRSSMQAALRLHLPADMAAALHALGDEAPFLFLVSQVQVAGQAEQVRVEVQPAPGQKCPRCWYTVPQLQEEGACARCVSNLHGPGEVRAHV